MYVEGTGQWHLPAALEHWELAGRAGLVRGPKSRRGRDDSCACPSGKALSPGKKGIFPKASRKACLKKLFLTKKNKYLTTLSSLDFRLFFCYFSLSGKILLHGLSGNVFIAVDTFLQREISKYAGVSSTGNTFFPDVPFPAPWACLQRSFRCL